MIRASELAGKCVRRENGEVLGHVFEIRTKDSEVTALICGARGVLQRLAGATTGHRIAWEDVRTITAGEIVVEAPRTRTLRRKTRPGRRRQPHAKKEE